MTTSKQIVATTDSPDSDVSVVLPLKRPLRMLSPHQIACIDRLLSEIGPYGEIRLVKKNGQLRFIQRLESEDAP